MYILKQIRPISIHIFTDSEGKIPLLDVYKIHILYRKSQDTTYIYCIQRNFFMIYDRNE